MLLGRTSELAAISAVCRAAVAGNGSVLVVSGAPGIGKTALLADAAEAASECNVVRATAVEAEATVAFTSLQALLWPLRDRVADLEPSQASLLRGILELGPSVQASTFTVGAATLALLSVAAESRPVVALVDDVQWADAASQEALCFVGRRLAQERVAILAGLREGEASLFADERSFTRLEIAALEATASRLLLERSSPDELAPGVVDLLLESCGGSPIGLVELPHVLTGAQRRGEESLPAPLEVGPMVRRAFATHASGLEKDGRHALLLLAASGEADLALLASLGVRQETVAEVESSGLVAWRGETLVFRHPLVQSAVFSAATQSERREAHRALAGVVGGARRAWHLARAAVGPDESVAEALEAAAKDARLAGGVAAQAQALERAAELTPDADRRAGRLLEAALAWKRAGRMEHAEKLLHDGLDLSSDIATRGRIQLERGNMLIGRYEVDTAYDLLLAESERAASVDPKIAAQLLDFAQLAAVIRGDASDALALAERALPLAGQDGDMAELEAVNTLHSARMLWAVPPDDLDFSLVSRAAELLERLELRAGYDDAPWVAYCLALHERDKEARSLSDVVLAEARAAGDIWMLSYGLFARAALELATGRLDSAQALATEGTALAEELGEPWRSSEAYGILGEVGSACGNVDESLRSLALMEKRAEWSDSRTLGPAFLAVGHFDEAIRYLESAVAFLENGVARAWYHLMALELAEAYASVGRRQEAEALVRVEAPGIESCRLVRPRARLARVRALLVPEARIDAAFAEALALLDEVPQQLERARVELCWGERLLGSRRSPDAVKHFEHALTRFDALGATGWAERTRRGLEAATGAPRPTQPRRTDVLTPQELRVAGHAGAGMRDREIAALLYLSPRTVESYLHSAYRKLGVSNRTQLAGVLAADGIRPVAAPTKP